MPQSRTDAASIDDSPAAAPSAPADAAPAAAKAVRKPAKRAGEAQAVKPSAEADPAAPVKAAKPAKVAPVAKPAKAVKAAAAEPVKPAKAVKVAKPVKPAKPAQPAVLPEVAQSKPRLVRDSFTIPELEYAQLEALKRRALALAHHAKKSEVLRAGIATLAAMDDAQLLAALQSVPPLKTGRPKKPKAEKAAVKARNGGKKS
ncbi:conserved hypothetical protein [Leptothrix cholodnii SP-6]|uniref:Uncharacterized protein n=1 Tax=Leptothrix cholodnii (strain ATCC 51168 / LMG 8142 / SP-6) TaxID=395495 RepID=B1Y4X5_LEPCP|nr:hypothetical protein [Leptothrix cholodnii]ACB35871.1 conserved hypothetical protein [Leptothrix cholodnii SP-6]